ncbi:hypothetical protein B9K09_03380 [Pseudomonas sp. M30-35]|nr:hypothetical protein B9K09_03380 [Pseudomonas sp. M30-35]
MGRRSVIEKLPAEIRNQFIKHVQLNPGWTLDSHVDWFAEHGYIVARSSIHRYISSSIDRLPVEQTDTLDSDLRMRALEVASSIYTGSDPKDLTALAEQFLAWVEQPSKPLP